MSEINFNISVKGADQNGGLLCSVDDVQQVVNAMQAEYNQLTAENQALREAATGLIGNALDMGTWYEISAEAYESLKQLLEESK